MIQFFLYICIEEWKDVPGYEGLYQVSNTGRVKSLNYHNTGEDNYMKPEKLKRGYLRVGLSKNNKRVRFLVHRLVAEAFIPNPHNLPQINHKDENPENNSVDNLEWCNAKYNANYGNRANRISQTMIDTLPSRKSVIMYDINDSPIRTFPSVSEASRFIGAPVRNISACCNGKRHTCLGYKWKFAS